MNVFDLKFYFRIVDDYPRNVVDHQLFIANYKFASKFMLICISYLENLNLLDDKTNIRMGICG